MPEQGKKKSSKRKTNSKKVVDSKKNKDIKTKKQASKKKNSSKKEIQKTKSNSKASNKSSKSKSTQTKTNPKKRKVKKKTTKENKEVLQEAKIKDIKSGEKKYLNQVSEFLSKNTFLIVIAIIVLIIGIIIGSIYTEQKMKKKSKTDNSIAPTVNIEAQNRGPTVDQLKKMPPVSGEDHYKGKKNAKLTIVEYSDYECPYSAEFHKTMQKIVDTYDVKWIYRHYPLSFHKNAQELAEAAECVAKLSGNELFWMFTDKIYERKDDDLVTTAEDVERIATEIGADGGQVKNCLDNGEYEELVKNQLATGRTAGVSGTPGSIIVTNDGKYELIPGALTYDQVKTMIDKYF